MSPDEEAAKQAVIAEFPDAKAYPGQINWHVAVPKAGQPEWVDSLGEGETEGQAWLATAAKVVKRVGLTAEAALAKHRGGVSETRS